MHRVPIKVGRIFNTYGPRMHPNDGRVVSNFIVQALNNQPLTLYGDGSQTRSFCYVDDLIEVIFRLMNSIRNRPLNIGNPTEFTVLARPRNPRLTGSRPRSSTCPSPPTTPNSAAPTSAKQKRCSVGSLKYHSPRASRARLRTFKRVWELGALR